MAGLQTICNKLSKNVSSAYCNTSGGTTGRQWVFQKPQLAGGATYNNTGALSSFTLKTGEKGIKANGKAKKGSGASAISTGENGGVVNAQTVVSQFKYQTGLEAKALMEFMRADGKIVFQETAKGTIRVYFWNFGSEGGSATDGTGTGLLDPNDEFIATITGEDTELPLFFEVALEDGETDQLKASATYLDSLTLADPA
ncbi:hypothetical protein [Hymenobacter sp. GOD-10R]|uniref:hypothetical protein n=1 Tax=Hymenobacter sp. GOD-10R TaxID=3093922 RepID=UPI002D792E3B|nr:hypothetical protein [Hymenobacter sp. GOD-10R]WRQ26674.1 hypothetical protein SD425_16500 [Hymenobacter sp. GOD-10R]